MPRRGHRQSLRLDRMRDKMLKRDFFRLPVVAHTDPRWSDCRRLCTFSNRGPCARPNGYLLWLRAARNVFLRVSVIRLVVIYRSPFTRKSG